MKQYSITKRDIDYQERRQNYLLCPNTIQSQIILDKYQATEKKLEDVKQILLQQNSPVQKLEIRENQMNSEKIKIICEMIRKNSSLNKIIISKCRLTNNQLKQVCEAICAQNGQNIQEIQFNNLKINKEGAQSIAALLSHIVGLKSLHLFDAGLDDETFQEICKGLINNMSIEKLDLRNNIFNEKSLDFLINTLKQHWSIKQLYLQNFKIGKDQIANLSQFLENKDCQIEDLELNEAEMDIVQIDTIMKSLYKTDKLQKLSLSNNVLNSNICNNLSLLPQKFHKFQSLTLKHCEIGEEALKMLCQGFYHDKNLKLLDLSWNNINSKCAVVLNKMLQSNTSIQKLQIQHNYLGVQGAKLMVDALKVHPQIYYLDISANEIGSAGFMEFLTLLANNHQLQNLHARKNSIKGEEILEFTQNLFQNTNLYNLDLKDNQIENECADQLFELLHRNLFIEDIDIRGNIHVNQVTKENIYEECKKNLLIKEYIIPCLEQIDQKTNDQVDSQKNKVSLFNNHKVDVLKLEDKSFYRSDFIWKFIAMNQEQFKQLNLTRVYFEEKQQEFDNIFKEDQKIESIQLIDCNLGEVLIGQLIRNCDKFQQLQELRLIKINLSDQDTDDIYEYLYKHKNLTILDLSYTGIINMFNISRFLMKNNVLKELIMTGNFIDSSENLRLLCAGMSQNVSVINLKYDIKPILLTEGYHDQIDDNELDMLNLQTKLNNFIQTNIIKKQKDQKSFNSSVVDLSNLNLEKAQNMEACIKYFRSKQKDDIKKTNLKMSNCKINDIGARDMVDFLLRINTLELDELDLSYNFISDVGCAHIANILTQGKKIKKLNLSSCQRIRTQGFQNIIKSIRKHESIQSLNFSNCKIDLTERSEWAPIIDDMTQNCSLIIVNLENNEVDEAFIEKLDTQLQQNKSIAQIIIPQIQQLQIDKKSQKQRKQTLNFDPRLKNIKGTGTINLGKYNRLQTQKQIQLAFDDKDQTNSIVPKRQKNEANLMEFQNKSGVQNSCSSIQFTDEIIHSSSSLKKQKQGGHNIQKLVLRGKGLTSLDFLEKYMRENPNIGDIDIGNNPLNEKEMQRFTINIGKNTAIRTIRMDGIKMKNELKEKIQEELDKNIKINELINNGLTQNSNQLNLMKKSIKNIGFLSKFLNTNQQLRVLDLTDNRLGNRGAIEICKLIQQTKTIEVLNLQNNRIGDKGLQHLCSALVQNESIRILDIRDNIIPDESLKIILAMLYRNQSIQNIKYSVQNAENIEKIKEFNKLSHLPIDELEHTLAEHGYHHELSWKEKICFPLWCWKSFIHDKHEAFRFKYDTKVLNIIEDELMDQMTLLLYLNSFIYYIIMFVCPIVFVNECNGGMNMITHYIYIAYSLATIYMEVWCVLKIQQNINNENILKFNKWHAMEIFMGLIARFDTYLDVCFFLMLYQCKVWNLVIPIGFFIVLYLIYPFYKLVTLYKVNNTFMHTLPKIERNCNLCFIRENMLLATVLDSFCISNNAEVCKKPIHLGRQMGIWTFLTQDGPQYFIHMLFIFVVHTEVSHSDTTVIMSLIVSTFAVNISLFNVIMCDQNEFDPILLQLELKKRSDKTRIREQKMLQEKEQIKQDIQNLIAGTNDENQDQKKNRLEKQKSRSLLFDGILGGGDQKKEDEEYRFKKNLSGSGSAARKFGKIITDSLQNLSQKKQINNKQNEDKSQELQLKHKKLTLLQLPLDKIENSGENTTIDIQNNITEEQETFEEKIQQIQKNNRHTPNINQRNNKKIDSPSFQSEEQTIKYPNKPQNQKPAQVTGISGARQLLDILNNSKNYSQQISQQGKSHYKEKQLYQITEEN